MSDPRLSHRWTILLVILVSLALLGCPKPEPPAEQPPPTTETAPPPPRCETGDTSLGRPLICVGDDLQADRPVAQVWDVEEDPAKTGRPDAERRSTTPVTVRWLTKQPANLVVTFDNTNCVAQTNATCDGNGECTATIKTINWRNVKERRGGSGAMEGKYVQCTYRMTIGAESAAAGGTLDVNPCCWPPQPPPPAAGTTERAQ